MKKIITFLSVFSLVVFSSFQIALADKPVQFDPQGNETAWDHTACADIQSGTIIDNAGNPISVGYDEFGYNYQAHMFNGTYDSSDRNNDSTYWGNVGDYVDDKLMMKWSDSWIANVDCNGDKKLDRGLVDGADPTGISMGWLTNHIEGDYTDENGTHNYTNFVKIVWTGPGSPLWGQYTVIEEVLNDSAAGANGLLTKPGMPGLGLNDQWTIGLNP